ncbi:MAG: transcription-repair coupling factor [Gammaproteobacteria bacterium]|nr:transcription-repair coupling factor [Gammaproteobacteria bacterium]MCY4217806.1 transcription-repair coupling factor [Gammaproteobacteria bacterium]MCY4274918.1 transcription-repair coupling factor [Gammaproteobacteria bacterium]
MLNPVLPRSSTEPIIWNNLHGSATGYAIAELTRTYPELILIVLDDSHQLCVLEDEIRFFLGDTDHPVLHLPGLECLPYEHLSPHQEVGSERIRILTQLPSLDRGILLVQTDTLLQFLPPVEYIYNHSFMISVGQKINFGDFRLRLIDSNYVGVDLVVSPGEFASRGGLIDVFPVGQESPFRLDFFDDAIDSIRLFDPDTQRTINNIQQIEIHPAREFPMTEAGIDQFRSAFREKFDCDPLTQHIYKEVSQGNTPPGIEFYLPLFFQETTSIFDYLKGSTVFITSSCIEIEINNFMEDVENRYENLRHDIERRILPPDHLYLQPNETIEKINNFRRIELGNQDAANAWSASSIPVENFPVNTRVANAYDSLIDYLQSTHNRILIVASSQGRINIIEQALTSHQIPTSVFSSFDEFVQSQDCQIGLSACALSQGLRLPDHEFEIISESQLFGEQILRQRRRSRFSKDPDTIIKSLAELNLNDPVTHIDHGVGRYRGLYRVDYSDDETEYIIIEYQNQDRLYIPVLSLQQVSRYIGGTPDTAPWHQLGSKEWEKAKQQAREKTYDVATELLEMDAVRQARKGFANTIPTEDFAAFIDEFQFEETPDQLQAIQDVINDLVIQKPMDRLICGDVGFGKTEVALRAAFIAVHNRRQVAILTPTTLLAQQHFETFISRFSKWPIEIEVLSRFKTSKQKKDITQRVIEGKIDIIIGTHALLQDSIGFANLGLVIVDEEHRFGVRQKEKLKKLRQNVDILAMTATPIPRTLNLAISGLRSISIIATPPVNRLPIRTFIRSYDNQIVREACLREIRRGGQVFFLHNKVSSIERMADELQQLVPEATVGIGHGQMPEMQLEMIMLDFYHQRFNVLICSTIIESGIDISTTNTIIINRADKFGLAQLHQLRGRVGRSHHQAYAYLLVPDLEHISGDASKRLDAIHAMGELGSGYTLATHDLEIRGAGELLGETQSGLIDKVGFSVYSQFLDSAIRSIRKGELPDTIDVKMDPSETLIDLHVPAYFPDDYLSDAHSRLIFYKRISNAICIEDLNELQIEAIDRFGLLPDPARNMFRLTALKLHSENLGISEIQIDESGGSIQFQKNPKLNMTKLLEIVQNHPDELTFNQSGSIKFIKEITSSNERLDKIEHLVESMSIV